MGIQEKSVCWTKEEAIKQIPIIQAIPNYGGGGVFVEKFIIGREFTAFVIGLYFFIIFYFVIFAILFHFLVDFLFRFDVFYFRGLGK